MASFIRMENLSGYLVHAFGRHIVAGTVVSRTSTAVGTEVQSYAVIWLGEGIWNRIVKAYWNGGEFSSDNYHFHKGELSPDMSVATQRTDGSWTQGVDPWIQGGQTFSGTAYVVVKLPTGVTEDDDLSGLKFVCECLLVPDYDNLGRQIDKNGDLLPDGANPEDYFFYSTNPARCMAYTLLFLRELPATRIDWAKWHQWKQFCDVEIPWVGGNVTDHPLYQNNNMLEEDNGGLAKSNSNNLWDSGAATVSAINSGMSGGFSAEISQGYIDIGLTSNNAPRNGNTDFTGLCLQFNPDSSVTIRWNSGASQVGNFSTWTTRDKFGVFWDDTAGWRILKNDVPLNISSFNIPPPTFPLYGGVAAQTEGAEIFSATMNPSGTVTTERTRKRFECGLAFTNQTDIADVINSLLYVSCSTIQDNEGQLIFLPPPMTSSPRASTFDFNASNMTSFEVARSPRSQKFTHFPARFRNIDSQALKEDTIEIPRDALISSIGRRNPAPEIWLGTITRGQAECVMNYYARLSDLDVSSQISADATSYPVLPSDVVTVTEESVNWELVKFWVISAKDKENDYDERDFGLQLYNDNLYSDTDHTPLPSDIINTLPTPASVPTPPLSFNGTVILNAIRWSWLTSTRPEQIGSYEIWNDPDTTNIANLRWAGVTLSWTEDFTAGVPDSVTRYLRAISTTGVPSSFVSQTISVASVVPPSNYTISYDGTIARHSWSPSVPATGISRYEIATDSGFTNIIFSGLDTEFLEQIANSGSITRYLRAVNVLEKYSSTVTANSTVSSPNPPTSATISYDGRLLLWGWTASTSPNVDYYEITNSSGTVVLDRTNGLSWSESQVRGTSVYSRRVYTVDKAGLRSTSFLTLGYTIPAPNPVSGLSVSFDTNTGLIKWAWTVSSSVDVESVVLSDNASVLPALVALKNETSIFEAPRTGTTSLQRNVVVISTNGQQSSTVSATFTAPIPSTPTISLNRQYPSTADVTVSSSNVFRAIAKTNIQISTGTGAGFVTGIIQTMSENGKQDRVTVLGRASSSTNLYVKVYYTDVWGQDSALSNELSLTFTPFLGPDLANNTVTSLQLLLNNFDNLAEDPGFEHGGGTWTFGEGVSINTAGGNSGAKSIVRQYSLSTPSETLNNIKIDVKPGDQFYIEGFVYAAPTAGGSAGVRVKWYDASNNFLSNSDVTISSTTAAGAWTLVGGTATAPANAVFARPAFIVLNQNSLQWYMDDMYFRKMVTSTIIGIAVIQTAHIADLAVTNAKIQNLSADKIEAAIGDIGLLFADQVVSRDYTTLKVASTTLNGALSDTATTITVTTTTPTNPDNFDANGNITIDGGNGLREIVSYTGKTGTTFTGCTRGVNGTTAVAHSTGATVSARARGWRLHPERGTSTPSIGELNEGVSIQGVPITEVQARAVKSIDNAGLWRGPDQSVVPTSAVISLFAQDYVVDSINNKAFVTLECGVDAQFDASQVGVVNGTSIDHIKMDILNKFGEVIGYNKYGTFNGKGMFWSGSYPRKYADPFEEAVFRIQIHNFFGYSNYLYRIEKTNTTTTSAPMFLARQNCPLDLGVTSSAPDSVVLNWTPAVANTGTQTIKVRSRNTDGSWSTWSDLATGIGSSTGTYTWTSAVSFLDYEFQVFNTGSSGAASNIAYCRTMPQSASSSRPAPSGLVGVQASSTSVNWSWTRNATDNTDVEYRLTDNGSAGSWTSLGSATTTSLTSSSLTTGHTYVLEVRNKWSSGTTYSGSATSNSITLTSSPTSTDPSNLNLSVPGRHQIQANWTNNGSVSQTLEYKKESDSSWTSVSLGAVNTYTIILLLDSTLYDVRVKATSGSNYVTDSIFTQDAPDDDPWCVMLNSMITLDGVKELAKNLVRGRLCTGKNNIASFTAMIGESTSFLIITNEFGDTLGCSPSHPFAKNLEETEFITALEIYKNLQEGKEVYVKMNNSKEYMARVNNMELFEVSVPVWHPTVNHSDHSFIANNFVGRNVKIR